VGTRDPFGTCDFDVDAPLPLIIDLRNRPHAITNEALRGARGLKSDLTGHILGIMLRS
jgi:hypothetical protein